MAVFTDYFDGPADQYLENRPGWSKAGLIDGAARLTGDGKIRCATADSGGGAYYREMGTPDHWVEAPVYTSVSNGFPVAIRIVDTSNYWGYRYTGTTHQLWRNVAGTFTQLDTSTDPFVPGDLIKMEAIGNDIRVYRNGVEILSINSASHNTATKAGLVARSTVVNPMTGQISVGFSTNTPDIRYNNEAPDIRYPFGPEDFRYPESFDGDFRIPGGDPDIRYYEGVVPQVNITGTVAVTFANFTSAATGTGQTTVTGTAANTFGNFTSAATGHKGTAWFVDSAVGTSGAGTSWATAWKAHSNIVWGSVLPGDTIFYSGGTTSKTYTGQLNVSASGSSSLPITITRAADANHNGTVTFDGQTTQIPVVNINGDNYITLQKFNIINPLRESCISPWNNTGCIIQDCTLNTGNGSNSAVDNVRGIHALSAIDLIIRRNTITTGTNTLCQADGIYTQGCSNFLIEDNTVTILNTDTTGHSDAWQSAQDNSGTVRNNTFISPTAGADNHVTWIHAIATGQTINYYNNVCWSKGGQFNVSYWRLDDGQGHGTLNIYNNTIYGGPRALNFERVQNVNIKNNIVWPDAGGTGYVTSILEIPAANVTHNLVWAPSATVANTVTNGARTYSQWTTTDGYNANGVNDDPDFTNAASGDFTLLSASPAINAGTTLATVTTDRNKVTRPQGSAYDMGAYEKV